jgi:hypothetical protein
MQDPIWKITKAKMAGVWLKWYACWTSTRPWVQSPELTTPQKKKEFLCHNSVSVILLWSYNYYKIQILWVKSKLHYDCIFFFAIFSFIYFIPLFYILLMSIFYKQVWRQFLKIGCTMKDKEYRIRSVKNTYTVSDKELQSSGLLP